MPPEEQYFAYLGALKGGTGDFTLGTNQIRYDAKGNPIAYGPKGKTTDEDEDPTWEEYLAAAEKAAGVNYFMGVEERALKAQYEDQYGGEKFTSSEIKKLEQAGLLNATRQEKLDYLYSKDEDTDTLPESFQ